MKILSKLEILNIMIAKYGGNPELRGISHLGGCSYINPEGNTCAVGMWLINPHQFIKEVGDGFIDSYIRLDPYLKPEVRGHQVDFWMELQALHDVKSNWNVYGLTERGEQKVRDFERKLKKQQIDEENES